MRVMKYLLYNVYPPFNVISLHQWSVTEHHVYLTNMNLFDEEFPSTAVGRVEPSSETQPGKHALRNDARIQLWDRARCPGGVE